LKTQERILGPEHPHTLASLNNLALLLSNKGDSDAAEPLYRRALEAQERILGPEHPDTLRSVKNLAMLLNATGRLAEAVVLLRERAAKSEACLAGVRYNLACYECLSGNLDEAKRLITEEITANPEIKAPALADADFAALHDFIAAP
jgi:Flp pilus assembly protein TadD